jgi:Protein of unknown function (DUF3179)
VYGRQYAGRELRFEASGGLLHSALVMRDKETGSYWPIMTGAAGAGRLKGTPLQELPVGVKMAWRDWVRLHPDTLVLSVDGVEHVENNPYDQYLASDSGFRETSAKDKRLPTKEPVYSFQLGAAKYAVPFRAFTEGGVFEAGGRSIFLYRPRGVAVYYSTRAFSAPPGGFERRDDGWYDRASGARFEPRRGEFAGGQGAGPARLEGFDTFWYIWSLTHPATMLLGAPPARR